MSKSSNSGQFVSFIYYVFCQQYVAVRNKAPTFKTLKLFKLWFVAQSQTSCHLKMYILTVCSVRNYNRVEKCMWLFPALKCSSFFECNNRDFSICPNIAIID